MEKTGLFAILVLFSLQLGLHSCDSNLHNDKQMKELSLLQAEIMQVHEEMAAAKSDNSVAIPDFGQYVFCWDQDADGDTATSGGTCEQDNSSSTCTYWSPAIWQLGESNSLPACGMFGPSCAVKWPAAIECVVTDQPDFTILPVRERHIISSRTIDGPRVN